MGCCIIAIFGAAWPRIALIIAYFANSEISAKSFSTTLWPLLGFLFMPTTTFAYEMCSYFMHGGTSNNWSIILIALAAIHDLGQLGLFRRRRKA